MSSPASFAPASTETVPVTMLLFIDESGHDGKAMPCEVLAGVSVAEADLWNLIRAIRHAETEHFGGYLRDIYGDELKAKKLLKRKRLKEAQRKVEISSTECVKLANSLLSKGKEAKGQPSNDATFREIVAFSRKVLDFVHAALDIAASFSVQVFASVVKANAPRPANNLLRKDYVYLFERYFYFLESFTDRNPGWRGESGRCMASFTWMI